MRSLLLLLGILGVLLPPTAANASSPAGVWLVIDKVRMLPNEAQPEQVQITGLVMLHSGSGPIADWGFSGFEKPQRGTLFYSCAPDKLAMCVMQWRELANATGSCRGFGSLDVNVGTLRKTIAAGDTPDAYPIAMGVVTGFTPCRILDSTVPTELDGGTEPHNLNDAGAVMPPKTEPTTTSTAGKTGTVPPPAAGTAGKLAAPTTPGTTHPATTPPPSSTGATVSSMPSAGSAPPAPVHVRAGCSTSGVPARPEPMIALWFGLALAWLRTRRRSRSWH